MKYKVGDKVRIKSIDWYNENKDKYGNVNDGKEGNIFISEMLQYCGKIATIIEIKYNNYRLDIDDSCWGWNDFMFEDKIEETMETKKIIIPEGWEVEKVENGEIILKEVKKELPKTWEECYTKLGKGEYISNLSTISNIVELIKPDNNNKNMLPAGLGKPMLAFCQLLVNRNAYRDGWEPDWTKGDNKYVIMNYRGIISTENYSFMSYVLSFQSMEIRDKFLENFRDLIEEAKELI